MYDVASNLKGQLFYLMLGMDGHAESGIARLIMKDNISLTQRIGLIFVVCCWWDYYTKFTLC